MTVDFFSVHDQLCNPFLHVVRIFYFDLVLGAAEGAVKCKVAEVFRDTRINAKTCEFRLYTKNCLGNIDKRPCGGTGQPAVLCLTEEFGVGSGYHLGVDIRLGSVDLADVFDVSRAGLTVDFKSTVATANDGLCNGNPWIVVAEDTGIFFVSRRIRGNFTEVQVIFGETIL